MSRLWENFLQNSNPRHSGCIVFIKPANCLLAEDQYIHFPQHGNELHYETEIVVLIGKLGKAATETDAIDFIEGLTLGLDLTLRDVQTQLKQTQLEQTHN